MSRNKKEDCALVEVLSSQPNTKLNRYAICNTKQYVAIEKINEDEKSLDKVIFSILQKKFYLLF